VTAARLGPGDGTSDPAHPNDNADPARHRRCLLVALAPIAIVRHITEQASDPYPSPPADSSSPRTTPSATATPPGLRWDFASDLPFERSDNALGRVERDTSNGEAKEGDGYPLILGGKGYAKGLGVHAPSEVVFRLEGKCSRLHQFKRLAIRWERHLDLHDALVSLACALICDDDSPEQDRVRSS
jgi:hypothetical protein